MLFFDYTLPDDLIAQQPVEPRDAARLLVLHRSVQRLEHRHFRDLPELLQPGDLLVVNDTKVLPARLVGHRVKTGGKWEALFLQQSGEVWELLAQTRGFAEVGEWFETESGLRLQLVGRTEDRHWRMIPDPAGHPAEVLAIHGQVPLPPYIRKGQASAEDQQRYQTVYAQQAGSVAAPTAGLHFTPELLQRLEKQGILRASVTLHVGLGTFAPVKAEDPLQHQIHSEWCEVPPATVERIHQTQRLGRRVIAVGTTTTRTLESAARAGVGVVAPYRGDTSLYIHPPYEFRVVNALITNFHLPRTTLLLLVQALSGTELLKAAYEEAIRERYRFYSYGDAMLIL